MKTQMISDNKTPESDNERNETRADCTHNAMVANDDPQHAWKCADCGYIYGETYEPHYNLTNSEFTRRQKHAAPAQAQHSPLPWRQENGRIYGSHPYSDPRKREETLIAETAPDNAALTDYDEPNAVFIVRACNNTQRLADVAKQAMEFAIYIIEENATPTLEECVDVREAAREALAEWSKK